MRIFLDGILGVYTPTSYVIYTSGGTSETVIPSGLAGLDWSYIFTGILFCIVVYCFLRMLGSIISRW